MRWINFLALSFLGTLAIGGNAFVHWFFEEHLRDASAKGVLGHQALSTFRLVAATEARGQETADERDVRSFERHFDEWTARHHEVVAHASSFEGGEDWSEPLESLISMLSWEGRAFGESIAMVHDTGSLGEAEKVNLYRHKKRYLSLIAQVHDVLTHKGTAELSNLRTKETAILGLTLIMLVIFGSYFFRPIINRSIAELGRRKVAERRVTLASRELTAAAGKIQQSQALIDQVLETIPYRVYWKDSKLRYLGCNEAHAASLGLPVEELVGCTDLELAEKVPSREAMHADDLWVLERRVAKPRSYEVMRGEDGRMVHLSVSKALLRASGDAVCGLVGVVEDVTAEKELEQRAHEASKLELMGELAAGIAHEINTPVQYVGDNTRFLEEAFLELLPILEGLAEFRVGHPEIAPDGHGEVGRLLELADMDYLKNEVPLAIKQSIEGIERIRHIVRAMKEFSHPGKSEKSLTDLNRAIESTTTVATSEWKYVADLELDLDPQMPLVPCLPNEFNQVILNLVVNAAHTIRDKEPNEKGSIVIRTRCLGEEVEVRVEDSGMGIPEEIREKIFEPFFTTKRVGKGTGQGLAIAREVIESKHAGRLDVQTSVGKGSTFVIRLPVPVTSQVPA